MGAGYSLQCTNSYVIVARGQAAMFLLCKGSLPQHKRKKTVWPCETKYITGYIIYYSLAVFMLLQGEDVLVKVFL